MGKTILTYWTKLFLEAARTMWDELGFGGLFFGLALSGVYVLVIGEQRFDVRGLMVFAAVFLVLTTTAWVFFVFKVAATQDKKKEDDINNLRNGQKTKPIIKLKDFGFELKGWVDGTRTINAYIDVSNQPKETAQNDVNAVGMYPTISWSNEQGKEIDKNNGRWAIPNEDKTKIPVSEMLAVDLDANGQPRRLHFSTTDFKSRTLNSWWRTWDRYDASKLIVDSPVYVMIDLKDKKVSTARFRFRITRSSDMLTLERVNNKKKVIASKEFKYGEALKYQTKERNVVKQRKATRIKREQKRRPAR